MSTRLKKPRQRSLLLLTVLLGMGGVALLRGQAVREMPEAEKSVRAEIQRQAASTRAEDRLTAVEKLASLYMDYDLLWQLMNDADPGVRFMAISAMTDPSCTMREDQPLSQEIAQKIAAMLEKEVTAERISAASAAGPRRDAAVSLATACASTLNHLYRYRAQMKSAAEYTAWQRRVLRPLFLAATDGGTSSDSLHACALGLFTTLDETSLLLEALPVLLQKLDAPTLPAPWLLPTLEALWQHPQLGHDKPLNILLLAQLAPRMEALRPRILGPMKGGQDQEQAARLLNEIAEVIQAARAKLGPQPATAAQK